MSFEIEGKLIEKFDTQKVSDSFRKREFVLETAEEGGGRVFTEQIKFQLIQDKCDLIDPLNLNARIKVHFNLKGRRWEKDGRVNYFTNLDAWRVEEVNAAASAPTNDAPPPMAPPADISMEEEEDDLPF